MNFSELKKLRISLGLDQSEFAQKVGVTRQYLSSLENNKNPIKPDFIEKIKNAGFLNTEPPSIQNDLNLTEQDWELITELILSDRELFLMLCKRLKTDRASVVKFLFGNQ